MAATEQDDRLKVLNRTLAEIERAFGKGAIMKLGDHLGAEGIEVISTGSISLDSARGVGGVPKVRVVEVAFGNWQKADIPRSADDFQRTDQGE